MIVKLLKTAFWLGIVIYNLPSPPPQSAAPTPHLDGGHSVATNTAGQGCGQPPELCTKTVQAPSKHGEPRKREFWRRALSQDTLTPADRAVAWHGLDLRKRSAANSG